MHWDLQILQNHKITHLMDDIKIIPKDEKKWLTLIQTIKIFSRKIEIEFVIGKYAMLVMKIGFCYRLVLWYISHCRLINAKSIFAQ